jgi:predicted phage terminase large subunit-like protein
VATAVEKQRAVAAALAQEDLYFFSRWMFLQRRGFKWLRGKQHQIICDALMRVYRGECKRLIINVPPRYSKTELAVINFIAWSLGRHPDSEFIHTSYSGTLAETNTWETRELVSHPAYREIFPNVALRADSLARGDWRTTAGGRVYASGSDGTIIGIGAGKKRDGFGGAIIMDDPHKANEARSDTVRESVIEVFQNTLESRRNSPHTPIILIMQRLHESDLAGWLLAGGNGEKWELVILPAIQEDGTALWPEMHTIEVLRQMQQAAPYTFSGQFQQQPAPPEGGLFKPDAMPTFDAIPFGTRFARGWDFASLHDHGDWTAGGLIGEMPDGRWLIADMARFQGSPDEVEAGIRNAAARDGVGTTVEIPQDPGQAGKYQVAYLTRQLSGFVVHSSPESGDKVTRAEPLAAQVNVGNVCLLRAPWNNALIAEMRLFPNGKYDDQIDALSRGFNALSGAGTWAFGSLGRQ